MIKPEKIVVIGGNAAGPAAAAKAKRFHPGAEVILFEAGDYISTGTCEIPYALSGEINNPADIIFFTPEKFFNEKGVRVFIKHLIFEINRKEKIVKARNLETDEVSDFCYDKLILATGSVAKQIDKFQAECENVFTLKTVADLLRIKDYSAKKHLKNVVIIGSGYIGLEAAEAFNKLGVNVAIIEKEDLPLPSAEREVRGLVNELLNQNNVRFFGSASGPRVFTEQNEVKSINLDSRLLEFDLILVAAGLAPNTELARSAGLETGHFGGIKVDYRLRTSDQHIFAAGDNIEVLNAVTGRQDYMPLATIARDFGHIAGENAAGGNKNAGAVVKNLAVKIFNRYFVSVGLNSEEAVKENYLFYSVEAVVPSIIEVMPGSEKVFGKILVEKTSGRILGASFFGGRETAGLGDMISMLIKTRQTADVLASVNYNYTPPLSPFVNILSVLGRKILKIN